MQQSTSFIPDRRTQPLARLVADIEERPQGTVVRIVGEATIEEINALRAHLMFVASCRPRLVVLDLAQLRFMGSLGWGALVEFRSGLVRAGGSIRLAGMQPHIEEAFRSLHLHQLFPHDQSVEAALAA
jgi:anti-anti-sigma factor